MRPVLRQTPVAGFHMAELALEDPEWVLDLGPYLRDDLVDLVVELIQLPALGGLAHDATTDIALFPEGRFLAQMNVALLSPDGCFPTVQKPVSNLAVMGLGSGSLEAVDYAAVGILAHMGFHATIPVVALLC